MALLNQINKVVATVVIGCGIEERIAKMGAVRGVRGAIDWRRSKMI